MTEPQKQPGIRWQAIGQIWNILPEARKRSAIKLWLLMMLGMVFEMLGIGLIVPVITVLTRKDIVSNSTTMQSILSALGNPGYETLIAGTVILLVIVYLLKNLYLAFLAWQQTRFIFGLQAELSQKLFSIYIRQPYTFHLQRNSAHLIRNIQGEMSMFINGAVAPCIQLSAEGLVVMGLFALLMWIEPLGSLAVFFVLGLAAKLFQHMTRKYVTKWGQTRLHHEGMRIKHLHQGLGGAKEVKLLGREEEFLNQYQFHTLRSSKMLQLQSVMQQMPRLWLELLGVTGLAILMCGMLIQGKNVLHILPTLALFAMVILRLMPSTNRMIGAVQQLRFSLPVIQLLSKELSLPAESPESAKVSKETLQDKLELVDVTFSYPKAEKPALQSISLEIRKNESVGFIGESGSGKSTLIDVILGLLSPDSGKILLDGKDITTNLRGWQNQIGYVPQSIYLTDDTLRRNVAFGLADDQIDDQAVINAIGAAQLDEFVAGLPNDINTVVGERGVRLSGGQRQRIGIARALYHDPEVLVLDEATSALDNETEAEVMQAVSALKNKTILIVAHRLSTIEQCDRLYKLDHGNIVGHGRPIDLLANIEKRA